MLRQPPEKQQKCVFLMLVGWKQFKSFVVFTAVIKETQQQHDYYYFLCVCNRLDLGKINK